MSMTTLNPLNVQSFRNHQPKEVSCYSLSLFIFCLYNKTELTKLLVMDSKSKFYVKIHFTSNGEALFVVMQYTKAISFPIL